MSQEQQQKFVDIATAAQMLALALPSGRHTRRFCAFLQEQSEYKVVNADQWLGFLRFDREARRRAPPTRVCADICQFGLQVLARSAAAVAYSLRCSLPVAITSIAAPWANKWILSVFLMEASCKPPSKHRMHHRALAAPGWSPVLMS